MKRATTPDFDDLTIEEQGLLKERLATLDFDDLTINEQTLLKNQLRRGPFCGYPTQLWIGQGGPVRKGDLEPPAFSCPPNADRKPAESGGVTDWLKRLLGRS